MGRNEHLRLVVAPRAFVAALLPMVEPRLAKFAAANFDGDAYLDERLSSLSDKGLRSLVHELATLRAACADELQRSVYADYGAFIRTAAELGGMQAELGRARSLLGQLSSAVGALQEQAGALAGGGGGDEAGDAGDAAAAEAATAAAAAAAAAEALAVGAEGVEVALAEGRLAECASLLASAQRQHAAASSHRHVLPDHAAAAFERRLASCRHELGASLADAVSSSGDRRERVAAAVALAGLADGATALSLLLARHGDGAAAALRLLRPPPPADARGAALFAAAASATVVDAMTEAADDMDAAAAAGLPGAGGGAAASALLAWASTGVAAWASMLTQHGGPLAPPRPPQGAITGGG